MSARSFVTTCSHRALFVLCGLVVVTAMLSSLLLNTARGEGAFRLADAQESQRVASENRLALESEVAELRSPERIARRAEQLGMVPAGTMGYVDPREGTVLGEAEPAEATAPERSTAGGGASSGRGSQDASGHPGRSAASSR